jgi:hypothetical protein
MGRQRLLDSAPLRRGFWNSNQGAHSGARVLVHEGREFRHPVLPATPVDFVPDLLMRGIQALRRALVRVCQGARRTEKVAYIVTGDPRTNVTLTHAARILVSSLCLVAGLIVQF